MDEGQSLPSSGSLRRLLRGGDIGVKQAVEPGHLVHAHVHSIHGRPERSGLQPAGPQGIRQRQLQNMEAATD